MADARLVRSDNSRRKNILDNRLSTLDAVVLMRQAKNNSTFFNYLKWTPAMALGSGVNILVPMGMTACTF